MVGNSSSGLTEAPSFRLPVVNIGDRQRGRIRAKNVIDVPCSRDAILDGIKRAISPRFRASLRGMRNPYDRFHDGRASERIKDVLKTCPSFRRLVEEEISRFVVASSPEISPADTRSNLPGLLKPDPMDDNVKPFLVPQTHTIRQAMEQLEKTEEKIVFVVDEESRLVGSLTDGDIRRWILSDGDLKAQVFDVCNRNPTWRKRASRLSKSAPTC